MTLDNSILDLFDKKSLTSSAYGCLFNDICADERIRFISETTRNDVLDMMGDETLSNSLAARMQSQQRSYEDKSIESSPDEMIVWQISRRILFDVLKTSKTPEGRSATFRVQGLVFYFFFFAARFLVTLKKTFFEPSHRVHPEGLFFSFFSFFDFFCFLNFFDFFRIVFFLFFVTAKKQ